MDPFYKKCEEDRRAIELENTKLKLRMVSRNLNSSKPSVDDYISNIIGSGLKFNQPKYYNKGESQSAKNINYIDSIYTKNYFNQSCNLQTQIQNGNGCHAEPSIKLPSLYQDVIDIVRLSTGELDTNKIYNIFITSGLSQEILGAIWSMINRTLPGQLTQPELVAGLSTIALCQEQITRHGPLTRISLPHWEQVVSLTDFPVPRIIISNTSPSIENDNVSNTIEPNLPDNNEEWADFSEFVLNDKMKESSLEIKLDNLEPLSSDLNSIKFATPVRVEHSNIANPVLNIGQEIDQQFSSWQDNIQSDKAFTLTKSKVSDIKSTDNDNIINLGDRTVPLIENKMSSTTSVLPTMTDADFGDFQLFSTTRTQSALDQCGSGTRTSNLDRYEMFNCDVKGPNDNLIDQWMRCLAQCLKILSSTVSVLKRVEDESIKLDVFSSDKGIILLQGIIEVYRVTRNIKLSASRSNILTSSMPMLNQLSDLEKCWNAFIMIIPDEMQIDVQSKLSRSAQDPMIKNDSSDDLSLSNVCGVCLCRIDHDDGFLSHGLHRYHCPCANLWVNTLDLTLPALS